MGCFVSTPSSIALLILPSVRIIPSNLLAFVCSWLCWVLTTASNPYESKNEGGWHYQFFVVAKFVDFWKCVRQQYLVICSCHDEFQWRNNFGFEIFVSIIVHFLLWSSGFLTGNYGPVNHSASVFNPVVTSRVALSAWLIFVGTHFQSVALVASTICPILVDFLNVVSLLLVLIHASTVLESLQYTSSWILTLSSVLTSWANLTPNTAASNSNLEVVNCFIGETRAFDATKDTWTSSVPIRKYVIAAYALALASHIVCNCINVSVFRWSQKHLGIAISSICSCN